MKNKRWWNVRAVEMDEGHILNIPQGKVLITSWTSIKTDKQACKPICRDRYSVGQG